MTLTNRDHAVAAQAAATAATLENVRVREQRSADAYAVLATRDERVAAKVAAREAASVELADDAEAKADEAR